MSRRSSQSEDGCRAAEGSAKSLHPPCASARLRRARCFRVSVFRSMHLSTPPCYPCPPVKHPVIAPNQTPSKSKSGSLSGSSAPPARVPRRVESEESRHAPEGAQELEVSSWMLGLRHPLHHAPHFAPRASVRSRCRDSGIRSQRPRDRGGAVVRTPTGGPQSARPRRAVVLPQPSALRPRPSALSPQPSAL
ncbi:MAG: hypothetical protein RI897_4561, partial [Verrucomicrobiota bacterium]